MWAYAIRLTRDDNGTFLVTAPDFPEVTTFGRTRADARRHATDAIAEAIAARMAQREAIPRASAGKMSVMLPTQAVAKVLLYRAMRDRDISKNELARRLNWHRPQVDRLLNLRHGTRLDAMERAFDALDLSLRIAVRGRVSAARGA